MEKIIPKTSLLIFSFIMVAYSVAGVSGITLYQNSNINANGNNITELNKLNFSTMGYSQIDNFFMDVCGLNESIQRVYSNGSYRCINIGTAAGTEGLEETLNKGNTAGNYQLNMSYNRITSLSDPVSPRDAVNKRFVGSKLVNTTNVSDDSETVVASVKDIDFGLGIDAVSVGNQTAEVTVNATAVGATAGLNQTLEEGNSAGDSSIDMNGNDIEMNGGNITAGNAESFCIGYCGGG